MIKINKKESKVWFTSDLHLGHKNIIKKLSTWDSGGQRDFDSVEEMDATIMRGINSNVMADDTLFLLGDSMFGKKDYDWLFNNIKCKNLYVLAGNHCHTKNLRTACEKFGYHYTSAYGDDLRINNKDYVISHYPILSWNNMGRGAAHLYGHVHDSFSLIKNPVTEYFTSMRTFDVGVDSAFRMFGDYIPFNLEFIIDMLPPSNDVLKIDHH